MTIRGTTLEIDDRRPTSGVSVGQGDDVDIKAAILGFYQGAVKLADITFEDRAQRFEALGELLRAHLTEAFNVSDAEEDLSTKAVTRSFRSFVSALEQGNQGTLPIEYSMRYLDLEMRLYLCQTDPTKPGLSRQEGRLLAYLRLHSLGNIAWNEIEAASVRTAIREALGELVAIRITEAEAQASTAGASSKLAAERLCERVGEILNSSMSSEVRSDLAAITMCVAEQLQGKAPSALDLLAAVDCLTSDLRFAGNLVGHFREGLARTSAGEPLQIIHLSSLVPDSILKQASELSKSLAMDPDKIGPQKGLSRSYSPETLRQYAEQGAVFTFLMEGDRVRGMGIAIPRRNAIAADTQELMQNTGFMQGRSLYVRSVGIEDKATWPQAPQGKYECLIEAIADWALAHGHSALCGQVRLDNTAMKSHRRVGFTERGGNREIEIDANGIKTFVFQAVERDTAEMMRRIHVEGLPIKCSWENPAHCSD